MMEGVIAMMYRKRLWEHALDHGALIRTRDAEAMGVPAVELRKLAARGFLDHVAYGVYRVVDAPRDVDAEYAEAVALVGADAYLTQDAVLALHDLGQVNPRRIRVGTPHRLRGRLPATVRVVHQPALSAADLTNYEGTPSTTVARALVDCKGLVMVDRLIEATHRARDRGLIAEGEAEQVERRLLEDSPA